MTFYDCRPKPEEPLKGVEAPEGDKAKAAVAEAVSASSQQTSDDLESAPVEVLPVAKAEKPEETKTSSPDDEDDEAVWEKVRLIRTKALALLESWSTLAEVFKIPRKVLRAEHEREAEEAEEAAQASSRLSVASENAASAAGSPSIIGGSAVHMTENRKRSYERSRGDYHHHTRPQVIKDSFVPSGFRLGWN